MTGTMNEEIDCYKAELNGFIDRLKLELEQKDGLIDNLRKENDGKKIIVNYLVHKSVEDEAKIDCLKMEIRGKERLQAEKELEAHGLKLKTEGKEKIRAKKEVEVHGLKLKTEGKERLQAQSAHSKYICDTSQFKGKALTSRAMEAIVRFSVCYLILGPILCLSIYRLITSCSTDADVFLVATLGTALFILFPIFLYTILALEGCIDRPKILGGQKRRR